jgi:4'-phosphopantetheinyl transferase
MASDVRYCGALKSDRNMCAFSVLKTPVVDVLGMRLDVRAEVSAGLWQLLSCNEREHAAKFRYAEHRQHYVVARATLRELLAERLRIAPEAVELIETEYGKPRLAPVHAATDVEFNLSHSGSLALYAFASGRAVGVDMELIREVSDADDLAERFFSSTETASLKALPREQRSLAFLACWTRKEALIKALGLGLSCPLDAFDVTIDPNAPARITRMARRIDRVENWAMLALTPYPGYIAALAYRQ